MRLKQKKWMAWILCAVTFFTYCGICLTSVALTDENDVSGSGGAEIGVASGEGSYMNAYCMWKVSVYVGKSDESALRDGLAGFDGLLAGQDLSKDYYKFGYSYYLYSDRYHGAGLAADNYYPGNYFLTARDKEWYVEHLEDYLTGKISGNDYFTQYNYGELSDRCFCGEDYGLTGAAKAVPAVPNFGGDTAAAAAFFSGADTSDTLIRFAAMAAGTDVNSILETMVFEINGHEKTGKEWGMSMISPIRGAKREHTSCVPWVFLYEPVVTVQLMNSYKAMALTATEIAVAMLTGRYNFVTNGDQLALLYRPEEQVLKNKANGVYLGMGIGALFQNLPNGAYTTKGWFGYGNLTSSAAISGFGATAARYVTDQLKMGGLGIRYQVSEAPLVSFRKTVTVEGLGTGGDALENFEFLVKDPSSGEQYPLITDKNGEAACRLRPGTYTITEINSGMGYRNGAISSGDVQLSGGGGVYIFTVTDGKAEIRVNNRYPTGTLTVEKQASGNDFSDTYFEISGSDEENRSVRFAVSSEGVFVKLTSLGIAGEDRVPAGLALKKEKQTDAGGKETLKVVLKGLPAGNYLVREHLKGASGRFSGTYVNGDYTVKRTQGSVSVNSGTNGVIHFDNVAKIRLRVNYLDKYRYEAGERVKLKASFETVLLPNTAYNVRERLDSVQTIEGAHHYVFACQGTEIGRVIGNLTGTAGWQDVEIDILYGYTHTVTVNYLDKYTGELLHTELIQVEG